jgi:hypothetical protein
MHAHDTHAHIHAHTLMHTRPLVHTHIYTCAPARGPCCPHLRVADPGLAHVGVCAQQLLKRFARGAVLLLPAEFKGGLVGAVGCGCTGVGEKAQPVSGSERGYSSDETAVGGGQHEPWGLVGWALLVMLQTSRCCMRWLARRHTLSRVPGAAAAAAACARAAKEAADGAVRGRRAGDELLTRSLTGAGRRTG